MSRTPHTAADTAMRDTQEENYIGGHYDALAAIGVSFLGPNGSLGEKNVSSKDFELVEDHLYDQFNVDVISISSFWAELWCHPALPEGRLPSSVGGLVAIWRDADGPAFWPLIGERGELEDNDESEKYAAVAAGFRDSDEITNAAIIKLADFFTDCQAITFSGPAAIIEFPLTDSEAFINRLASLPFRIAYFPYALRFHNGPLPNTPRRKRAQNSEGEVLHVQATAKKLVHSLDLEYWDELLVDASPTGHGLQRLLSVGSRVVFERGTETYIAARQIVCATGDPILTKKPRDTASGAVVLTCKDASGKSSSRDADVLARGEVCGMFRYDDLTPKYVCCASEHLIYMESFDHLIEEGWEAASN